MNTLQKSTGNYINPLDPVYDLPYDPKGGSGILKAKIWVTIGPYGDEELIEKYLPYSYSVTVNGTEVEIEKPNLPNARYLDEDIYNSMRDEMKFDHINYIVK